jgi:hypothetical protein
MRRARTTAGGRLRFSTIIMVIRTIAEEVRCAPLGAGDPHRACQIDSGGNGNDISKLPMVFPVRFSGKIRTPKLAVTY